MWQQTGPCLPRLRPRGESTGQEFPQWLSRGTILRGLALAMRGQGEEGITQIRQGMIARQSIEGALQRSHYLGLLAEAYGKAGRIDEGLLTLAESLEIIENTGERFYEAEIYRLKGDLLLKQVMPSEHEAEDCFHQALVIARRRQAKSLELRAAIRLSRLWQCQGKRAEARLLLGDIYGWFTEGFDTVDLPEARALLEALS
jgi:predicted ATPase